MFIGCAKVWRRRVVAYPSWPSRSTRRAGTRTCTASTAPIRRRLFNRLTGRSSTYDGGYRIATTLRRLHRSVPVDIVEMEESFGWAINVSRSTRLPLVVKLHGPGYCTCSAKTCEPLTAGRKFVGKVRRSRICRCVVSPSRRHLEETLSHYGIQPAVAEQVVNPLGLVSDVPLWIGPTTTPTSCCSSAASTASRAATR